MKRQALVLGLLAAFPLQAQDVLLGTGVRHRPVFDGSDKKTTDLIPVLRYYGRPWFARTTQGMLEGGARAALGKGLDAGAQLAYEQGPRDAEAGASFGAHLEWDAKLGPAPLNALLRWRRHFDSARGALIDARLTAGVYERRGLAAAVFTQATWASEKHFESYYGLADSGLLFTSLGLLGSYDLSRRWLAVASIEARRLADNAAPSAFVRERSNTYMGAGLAYRF